MTVSAVVRHYIPVGEAPTVDQLYLAGAQAAAAWTEAVDDRGLTVHAPPTVRVAVLPDSLAIRSGERAVVAYGQARRPYAPRGGRRAAG